MGLCCWPPVRSGKSWWCGALDRLVDLCNDWNRDKLWPKTYVTVDDAGAVRVRTELNIDMEYGASDLQLKQSLDCGIATSMSFFESLDKKFPDTRFAQ